MAQSDCWNGLKVELAVDLYDQQPDHLQRSEFGTKLGLGLAIGANPALGAIQ